jgi:hypothetical protein
MTLAEALSIVLRDNPEAVSNGQSMRKLYEQVMDNGGLLVLPIS